MNLSKHEGQVLVAIYDESCETRRDVRTDMACIAANAGTSAQRAMVMLALAKLKRLGLLVNSDQEQTWGPTQDGRLFADAIKSGAIKCHPEKVAQNRVAKPELDQSTPAPAPQAGPAQPETLALGPGRIQKLTRGLSTSLNQLRNQHDDELQAELLAVIDGLGELAAQEYRRTADPHIGELPGVCADLHRRVERARICSDASGEVAA